MYVPEKNKRLKKPILAFIEIMSYFIAGFVDILLQRKN
jgi:hypothetical protein